MTRTRSRESLWAHPRYPRWLLLNCLVGLFSTSYTSTILAVSFKKVAENLDSTPGVISWVMLGPTLASAVAVPILGRLGDIKGHRRVYLWGFVISIVFNALAAAAPNPGWLIASRTIAQIGGSAIVPSSFAILFRAFPPDERVRAAAWVSAVFSGSSVAGLIIGGPMIDAFGWRPLFIMQAGLGLLALLPGIVLLKPDVDRKDVTLDYLGAVLLGSALFCLTFGINRLTKSGPRWWVVALLVAVPVVTWFFVRLEKRVPTPILPLALATDPSVATICGSAMLFGGGWVGTFVITPLLLQTVFGFGATATSFLTLARTLSITFAAPLATRAARRAGERKVLAIGAWVVAVGLGLSAIGARTSTLAVVIVALVVTGLAWGHVQPATAATLANAVDEADFGLASSLQQMAASVGSVVGLGFISALAADTTDPSRFALAFAVATGCCVGGALLGQVLLRLEPAHRVGRPSPVT